MLTEPMSFPTYVTDEELNEGIQTSQLNELEKLCAQALAADSDSCAVALFINEQEKETDICLVGNMVDLQTRASEQLQKFIQSTGLSSPTMIRQAQIYVHLAAHGLTLFDSKSNIFENEIKQWEPLIDWLLNDDETQDQDIVVD